MDKNSNIYLDKVKSMVKKLWKLETNTIFKNKNPKSNDYQTKPKLLPLP